MSFIFLFFVSLLLPVDSGAATFWLEPSRTSCIRAYDGGRRANGQQLLKFYSACPEDMYINVCVKDDRGEVKLYKSPSYIKTNGTYTVYTFPNSYPSAVQWAAASSNPAIPPLCTKERK